MCVSDRGTARALTTAQQMLLEDAVIGPKQALALAKDTFKEFLKDDATWMAAALSYFTVFALAPLLVILLQVASLIWDATQVRDALTGR